MSDGNPTEGGRKKEINTAKKQTRKYTVSRGTASEVVFLIMEKEGYLNAKEREALKNRNKGKP